MAAICKNCKWSQRSTHASYSWTCGATGRYCAEVNPDGSCQLFEQKPPWPGIFLATYHFLFGDRLARRGGS